MKLDELYMQHDCEVSKSALRTRLAAGEPYDIAKKLRNFIVCGKKYKNLWELSKETLPHLTYQQLLYRIAVMKKTPTEAVYYVLDWVEGKRETGKGNRSQRTACRSICAISRMNEQT